jgi:hypothetical protein
MQVIGFIIRGTIAGKTIKLLYQYCTIVPLILIINGSSGVGTAYFCKNLLA